MLNHVEERQAVAVTLPKLAWLNQAPPDNVRETAQKLAELRIVRAGVDAWAAIAKAKSLNPGAPLGRPYRSDAIMP